MIGGNQYGCDSIITVQLVVHQKVNALDDEVEIPANSLEVIINVLTNDIYPANGITVKIYQNLPIGDLIEQSLGIYKIKMPRVLNNPVLFIYQICSISKDCPIDCDSASVKVTMKDKDFNGIRVIGVSPNLDLNNGKIIKGSIYLHR